MSVVFKFLFRARNVLEKIVRAWRPALYFSSSSAQLPKNGINAFYTGWPKKNIEFSAIEKYFREGPSLFHLYLLYFRLIENILKPMFMNCMLFFFFFF